MYKFIPWRKIRILLFFLIFLSLSFVNLYLNFLIQVISPKKIQQENYSLKISDCYRVLNRCSPILCISNIDKIYCLRSNLVLLKIETSAYMCFQHNQREIKKKIPYIIEEQSFVVQLNVVEIEPLIQSDFRFRNLILTRSDIILCIAFSILIFFYINRVLLDTVFICEKC